MTVSKEDRNQFIVDEFEDGAKISDIVNHPSVNIKHQSVRRILINKLGHEKYKEIVSGRGDRFYHPTSDVVRPDKEDGLADLLTNARKARDEHNANEKKSFWKWLIGE
tara:strand:+ start:142 stop:465 length:324 start_codon:yes stop_codon:yes gene_type:complete